MSPCLSNFTCNPMLELFCWWKLTAENKGVETGFVDPNGMLSSSKTVYNRWGVSGTGHLIFIRNILSNSLCGIWISQCYSYILTYEPWFPWDFNSSQLTEFWMIEYCWGFCVEFWLFAQRARCQRFPFTVVGEWEITNFLTSKKFIKYCYVYSSKA